MHQKIYEIITGHTSGILKADSNCFCTTPMELASSLSIEIILLLAKKRTEQSFKTISTASINKNLRPCFLMFCKIEQG